MNRRMVGRRCWCWGSVMALAALAGCSATDIGGGSNDSGANLDSGASDSGSGASDTGGGGSVDGGAPWTATSTGVTVENTAGFAPAPPKDAGPDCKAIGAKYTYVRATGVATRATCAATGASSKTVTLTGSSKDTLEGKLAALKPVPLPSGCVADAPSTKITVAQGGSDAVFYDEFSSCSQPNAQYLSVASVNDLLTTFADVTK